jgi:hypothetical protein
MPPTQLTSSIAALWQGPPYLEAIEGAFGGDVDYAMLVKMYGDDPHRSPERKYRKCCAPLRVSD